MEKTEKMHPSNPKELRPSPLKMGEKGEWLFDQWNKEKQKIDEKRLCVFAKPRDVCYIKLGYNVWYEENGKTWFLRPVLVINKIGSLYFVIPLTSKNKYDMYHYQLHSIYFNEKKSFAILSQGRIIDGRRLIEKKWVCDKEEFHAIKKILRNMYFPE